MIVIVYGTRPESIKLGPVVAELRTLGITPQVIATNQHWDLLKGTPAETDLADSVSLGLSANGDLERWVDAAVPAIRAHLPSDGFVVVQGDTVSALAGARAANESNLPLVHIEAGVRSHTLDEPFPEEGIRREITQLAAWHYAPTQHCVDNLLAEGVSESQIRLTGNPVVSALARYADAKPQPPEPHLLLTMHRREWLATVDLPAFLHTLAASAKAYPHLTVTWPVHPAVWAQWPPPDFQPRWPHNVRITKPLEYRRMISLLATAQGLATDSGGLVEEATTLGIPTAILRNANDRPEAVHADRARQFAPHAIEDAFRWLATRNPFWRRPSAAFGHPDAAAQIATHLASLANCHVAVV